MANKKTTAPAAETVENGAKSVKNTLSELQQSVYTPDEFASMSGKFGTTADIVKAALVTAGKKSCSFAEAEKIVKKFLS